MSIKMLFRNITIGLFSHCRSGVNRRKKNCDLRLIFLFLENESFLKYYKDFSAGSETTYFLTFLYIKLLVNKLICLIKLLISNELDFFPKTILKRK